MATSVSLSAQGLIVYGVVLISAITSGAWFRRSDLWQSGQPGSTTTGPTFIFLTAVLATAMHSARLSCFRQVISKRASISRLIVKA
jgi:hypothetical protein